MVTDILRRSGGWEIVGFLDDVDPRRQQEPFAGAVVLGTREQLPGLLRAGIKDLALAVGSCQPRLQMLAAARAQGFNLVRAIHPQAVVSPEAAVGEGAVVAAGAVVNPGANIGAAVILNTSSSVDHECVIEDGAHLCPGVHLAGRVQIGRGAWIGIGAIVKDRVRIGEGAVIGAGAGVLNDIPAGALAYGVPAKVIRQNE